MAVAPQFLVDLETTVRYAYELRYKQTTANLVYDKFTRLVTTQSLKQQVKHRQPYVTLHDGGETGGDVKFDDARIVESAFSNRYVNAGFEITEQQAEDLDEAGIAGGEAIRLATEWAQDLAYAEAYYPQRLSLSILRGSDMWSNQNTSRTVYTGKELFATDQPIHVGASGYGVWSNLYTGAPVAAGDSTHPKGYPGFLPLAGPFKQNGSTGEWEYSAGDTVPIETARANLYQIYSHISTIVLPDGITPALIKPKILLHSPALREAVQILTASKFISMSSKGGGGGTTDVAGDREGILANLGWIPVEVTELGITRKYAGTEQQPLEMYDWYLVDTDGMSASQLGLIQYQTRRPFMLQFFNPMNMLELAISRRMKWIATGRYGAGPAVPYYGFCVRAPGRV